jgi:hypothetical protein
MSTITHLIAGVPVSDLDAGIDWYTRLFGRPPDMRAGKEILWDIDKHATVFIEPNPAQAGAGRITLVVVGGSTRSWSASPPSASRTNRSRPTRTARGTRRSRSGWQRHRVRRAARGCGRVIPARV